MCAQLEIVRHFHFEIVRHFWLLTGNSIALRRSQQKLRHSILVMERASKYQA
jgi:hypothetical protein